MMYSSKIFIQKREISINSPTYFIADIGANHDGSLSRAKDLICLAKESGADAVKFQHFLASKIVSDYGFKNLESQLSHQSKWKKSVFDVYKQYECDRNWTEDLIKISKDVGIDILTTPYDENAVELWDSYSSAFKIGSGDITWLDFIALIAKKNKPTFLATGASNMQEVEKAIEIFLLYNKDLVLMQCNTNYTASTENFKYINLNVLRTFAGKYPGMILGLSDHTSGHSTVLGAIVLGARVIEKHFTDDNSRVGPDHLFAMNPSTWSEMVDRSRELELALGDGIKRVELNEQDTVVVQRRCIRLKRNMHPGEVISSNDIEFLRPAPIDAFLPYQNSFIIGKKVSKYKEKGSSITQTDLI